MVREQARGLSVETSENLQTHRFALGLATLMDINAGMLDLKIDI